jgi:hypothetical protein
VYEREREIQHAKFKGVKKVAKTKKEGHREK